MLAEAGRELRKLIVGAGVIAALANLCGATTHQVALGPALTLSSDDGGSSSASSAFSARRSAARASESAIGGASMSVGLVSHGGFDDADAHEVNSILHFVVCFLSFVYSSILLFASILCYSSSIRRLEAARALRVDGRAGAALPRSFRGKRPDGAPH
jgi:hypothetical protein